LNVTWAFIYLACLLVGLVLAAVSGLLGDLRALFQNQQVAPPADFGPAILSVLGRRLAAGMLAFGLVGLVLVARGPEHHASALTTAAVAGVLAALLGILLLKRRHRQRPAGSTAVVVRDIPPGGYGQIRLTGGPDGLLMAAHSDEPTVIPAGSQVDVLDLESSVVLVRRAVR
jgi:membrane-bound ClpP family serine protease